MCSQHPNEPCYVMSIASRLVDLHPQTLRRYEMLGLIKPARVSGRRLYSPEDIERLRIISHLTDELGVNLAGVEVILEMRDYMAQLRQQMDEMQRQFEQEMAHLRKAAADGNSKNGRH